MAESYPGNFLGSAVYMAGGRGCAEYSGEWGSLAHVGHLRALGTYEFMEVSHGRTAFLQQVRMPQLCSSSCARGCTGNTGLVPLSVEVHPLPDSDSHMTRPVFRFCSPSAQPHPGTTPRSRESPGGSPTRHSGKLARDFFLPSLIRQTATFAT